jgi:putative redox protein
MSITVQKSAEGTLAFSISIRDHTITTDVNAELGGDDLGPSPHDIFDASLAACTALTVKIYAARKSWPLENIQVEVERDASREGSGLYRLTLKIHLVGALNAEQSDRLFDVANKCPIHKLMQADIKILTERF